ncbi:MAG TPA: metal-dependent phosphohydrolase [Planctomycetaceae bacterium]|nr:metal-dependent phosphohydrolase [Planctomycetaceae bacterium]
MAASGSRKTRSGRVAAIELPPSKLERALAGLARRDVLLRLALGLLATVGLVAIMHAWTPPFPYRADYIPPRDLVARAPFQKLDVKSTEKEMDLARDRSRAVFAHDPEPLVQLRAKLRLAILEIVNAPNLESVKPTVWEKFVASKPEEPPLSGEDRDKQFQQFRQEAAGDERLAAIDTAVGLALERYEKTGLLRKPVPGNQDEILVYPAGQPDAQGPVKVSDVKLQPRSVKDELTRQLASTELVEHLFAWLQPKLAETETLSLDEELTRESRKTAADGVENVYTNYEIGQLLAPRGKPLGPEQLDLLRREYVAAEAGRSWGDRCFRCLAIFAMIAALFCLSAIYLFHRQRDLLIEWKRLIGLLALIVVTLLVARWAARDPWNAELVPVLLFGQIIAIVYNRELALLLSGIVALLTAIALGLGLSEFLILFGVSATVILQLTHIRSRNKLIVVGFFSGLAAAGFTLASAAIDEQPFGWTLVVDAARHAGLTLAAGFLMTGLLPFIERIFGVLTDIRLLDLGDVAHPLLQELIRRAPSTYNHSITVGSIAEAAAEAIGARGLLVRVGAYFHDIGKMLKPGYFIENQGDAVNRHETLVPAMSTLVIIAHIKDGANLARQHHLPEAIIDFILQHHGTTLVGYFFERAKQRSENPDAGDVDESSFRYPGPKPQTKEAAVLMLADAVESASRTLVGPTPARIEGLVREIAERRLEDGQFDESGLTLRELRMIEDSMIKTVTAIYHGRLKYPDQRTA